MTTTDIQDKILSAIYTEHTRTLSQVDEEELSQIVGIKWNKIEPIVKYLEQKGYITSQNKQFGIRLYRTFNLTPKGIDRFEGKEEDKTLSVEGDYVHITVGDNAKNLALGKEIVQQQTEDVKARVRNLDTLLYEFLEDLDSESAGLYNDQIILLKQQVSELRETFKAVGLISH